MDRVSALLGHSSIKVTEKHYSPWVWARQEQLEADGGFLMPGDRRASLCASQRYQPLTDGEAPIALISCATYAAQARPAPLVNPSRFGGS
jgi:hypothetical protein